MRFSDADVRIVGTYSKFVDGSRISTTIFVRRIFPEIRMTSPEDRGLVISAVDLGHRGLVITASVRFLVAYVRRRHSKFSVG